MAKKPQGDFLTHTVYFTT